MGAASMDLAYVASGKLDAFWERNLNIWDVCSWNSYNQRGWGKVTLPDGKDWTIESSDILASNLLIHQEVAR